VSPDVEQPAPEEMTPLRRSVVTGVKWGTASAGAIFVIGLVQTATLAHLLTPSDFGLVAAAAVVLGLARAFADLGLSSAIVARQVRDHETLSSLYWASLIAGLAMFGIVLALMPLMVIFYREPELYHIIPWAALSFVIVPIGQQFQMILQMDLHVERLVKVDVASAVIALLVAVGAALAGAGALALVFGYLARLGVTSLLFAVWGWKHWRPSFRLRRKDLDGYIGFGLYQMGERTANFLSANVDYLLVGRYLGLDALGAYSIAYQLVVKPVFELNPILTRVAFPAFSKKQEDDSALARGYVEVIRLIAFIIVPTMAAVAALAPVIVPVLFGEKWHASIVLLQILAVVGVTRGLTSPVGDLVLAKNRPDVNFRVNAVLFAIMAGALFAAVHVSLVAVAATSAAVNTLDFVLFLLVVRWLVGLGLGQYWHALRWTVVNSALAAAAMLATRLLLEPPLGVGWLLLVISSAVGVVTYLGLGLLYERRYILQMVALVRPVGVARSST
jgi:O-antigen/teichoic acid export membrane protein